MHRHHYYMLHTLNSAQYASIKPIARIGSTDSHGGPTSLPWLSGMLYIRLNKNKQIMS